MENGGESKTYPDEQTYNKLVRDNIVGIIEADGKKVETRVLSAEEAVKELKRKAVEEAKELEEAEEIGEIKKEASDLLQVVVSLAEELGIPMSEIEDLRKERAVKRGEFKSRTYLVRTFKD